MIRGFDGMYGTVTRWVQQVAEWNPSLSEQDCFTVVRAWLGINLPEIESLADMELELERTTFMIVDSDGGQDNPYVEQGIAPAMEAARQVGMHVIFIHNDRSPSFARQAIHRLDS